MSTNIQESIIYDMIIPAVTPASDYGKGEVNCGTFIITGYDIAVTNNAYGDT